MQWMINRLTKGRRVARGFETLEQRTLLTVGGLGESLAASSLVNTDNDGTDEESVVLGDASSGLYDSFDTDGDGDHDLIVVEGAIIGVAGSTDGDPTEQEVFVGGNPTSGAYDTHDLDGDGDHDLVVVAGDSFVQADTDNDPDDVEVFVLGSTTSGLYDTYDLDGDGDHDLVVVDGSAITVGEVPMAIRPNKRFSSPAFPPAAATTRRTSMGTAITTWSLSRRAVSSKPTRTMMPMIVRCSC